MNIHKKIFNWLYPRLFMDKEVVSLLAEYSHLPAGEVKWLLTQGGRLNNDLWLMQNPITKEQKNHFYEVTPFYLFELFFWHMTYYQKNFRQKVLTIAHGKVLDFGGGVGDLSLALVKSGRQVDYADVSGNTFNF